MNFCWVTINFRNKERSLTFYREVLGLEIKRRIQSGPDMEIVSLGSGRIQVELICNKKVLTSPSARIFRLASKWGR